MLYSKMYNVIKRVAISGLFPISTVDVVSKDIKTVREADMSVVPEESGWDRLRLLFSKNDFGEITPELHSIIQISCMSSFIGFMYGGVVDSREAYLDFMKNNQATTFKNHLDAKKKLQDKVMLSFAKGAFRWGWRLSLFTASYVTFSTSIAAYRGKNGIIEHSTGGLLAGALYKFKLGPRAWIVGGGLGLVLGTMAGIITSSLLKLTGMTMEEARYWNYKWMNKRSEAFNAGLKKHLENEQIGLLTEHADKFKDAGTDLDVPSI